MPKSLFSLPEIHNEPVLTYEPGSPERKQLREAISEARSKEVDIPMVINGEKVRTGNLKEIRPPHNLDHLLGVYHQGNEENVTHAIESAKRAKKQWADLPWENRASVFLKAATLISGPYRAKINAATMLCQSKNVHQAEIDSACELIDFLNFNIKYMNEIYTHQPDSRGHTWNRLEQRPLEGFVFALTPFNFTAISGNLPTAPAIMGNTVVWKPSKTQIYSASVFMEVLREAGLPDGVINMVFSSGPVTAQEVLSHPDFGGVHFTGSTDVFRQIWHLVGKNMAIYKSYPRIVGETGGKNYVIAHESAKPKQVATALIRGAYEYQGQKCSAVSRAYIPKKMWPELKQMLLDDLAEIKIGPVEDFTNFVNAVIDEPAFEKIKTYIDNATKAPEIELIAGGKYDKSKGYFIEPTILLTSDPHYVTMEEEIFGPVLTVYLYDEEKYGETLELVDNTSIYGLTGAVFSTDRYAIELASKILENTAGNFYINDKPTGSVVNQQPFGGARASGTNDKAGSSMNLMRWVSTRSIKETYLPDEDYKYPFMKKDSE